MIIQLEHNLPGQAVQELEQRLEEQGLKSNRVKTQFADYLVGIPKREFDIRSIGQMPGIVDIHRVSDNYKLVSRKWKMKTSAVDLGDGITIGAQDFAMMAGPCSIESEEQIEQVVEHLVKHGVKIMRGGVFKPRSSPYAFRGLGIDGLKLWYKHARAAGLKIITEVMQSSQIEEMYDYVDIFQVGARNSQNFNLLDALGQVDKAVLLKRGISGTIDELLYSAEYVFSGGNEALMLCERGIRTYENATRNTFDLNAVPILKEKSHLPVIADPSHAIGIRRFVEPMALASVMAGADGLIYETHRIPEEAFSDGQQTLSFEESEEMIRKVRQTVALRDSL